MSVLFPVISVCVCVGMCEGGSDEAAAEYNGRAARLHSYRRAARHCPQQDGGTLQRRSEQGQRLTPRSFTIRIPFFAIET